MLNEEKSKGLDGNSIIFRHYLGFRIGNVCSLGEGHNVKLEIFFKGCPNLCLLRDYIVPDTGSQGISTQCSGIAVFYFFEENVLSRRRYWRWMGGVEGVGVNTEASKK